MPLADAGDRRHDLSRGAEAALKRIMLDEGGLHGVEPVALGKPLDRGDLAALGHDRQRQARQRPAAVDMHRAGAAFAAVAALLGPGQAEMVPERVEERDARIDPELP